MARKKKDESTKLGPMKKWRVYGVVTGSKLIGTFEAATEDEALDMASGWASVNVCWHCSKEIDDPQIGDLQAEEVEAGSETEDDT